MLSLPFGNVGGIDHVYRFHLGRKFLLSPSVRTPGLLVIIAVQPLVLVLDIYFTSLFEHPAVSVSVVCWLIRGAMNLARAFKYAVQTGWSLIVSFERLFPLTGFRATESGVDCRVFCVVAIVPMLMSVASWLAVTVADIRSAGMWCGAATSQPAVLARAKVNH